jgi:thioredoxin-dependent peroxiredoxin
MDETGGVTERHDEAYQFDEKLTVVGAQLGPGDPAPEFRLSSFDAESGKIRDVQLADSAGEVRLPNVVNSLDTPVCHVETRRWEQLRNDLPEGVRVYTISMDLPFGQARWRRAEGVEHEAFGSCRRRVRR